MTTRIFGIKDDGARDLCGIGPSADQMIKFAHAAGGMLEPYPKAVMEDDAPLPRGLSMWVVYDRPREWPTWYVARQFIFQRRTGNMVLCRGLNALREDLAGRGLVQMSRAECDDPIIVETWL